MKNSIRRYFVNMWRLIYLSFFLLIGILIYPLGKTKLGRGYSKLMNIIKIYDQYLILKYL
jgi:hypothetical protein